VGVRLALAALAVGACDDGVAGPHEGVSGLSFDQIAAGGIHTCGLDTSTGQAYCWGRSINGETGDGTTTFRRTIRVAVRQSVLGGITFDQIAAGGDHTCGLDTSTGQAYCWGLKRDGELGNGTRTSPRTTPVAVDQSVLGGITFDQIAAGFDHTCGLDASTGQAYCWGSNHDGELGDGTRTPPRTTPVAVDQTGLGGITFDQLSLGGSHTCGLDTPTGQAYCWGSDAFDQLGNGTMRSPRLTPTPVLGTGNDR